MPETFDTNMTAAECREHERKTWDEWQEARNELTSRMTTPDERASYYEIIARLSDKAREWQLAGDEAEKRENET